MSDSEFHHGTVIGRELAGLAADDSGESDDRHPLVLLHGLTFDRRMWGPTLEELQRLDPERRVLALDLPGHGGSMAMDSYRLEAVAEAVYGAVEAAGLDSPVIVGHSVAGIIATRYAVRHPTSGVINVDQSLRIGPFAEFARSVEAQVRGPEFSTVWSGMLASMHIEELPAAAQELLRSSVAVQAIVVGYWEEAFDRPADDLTAWMEGGLSDLRSAGTPYLIVTSDEPEADYRNWVDRHLPQATIVVWPGASHFPHLAHPARFAALLADSARWPTGVAR